MGILFMTSLSWEKKKRNAERVGMSGKPFPLKEKSANTLGGVGGRRGKEGKSSPLPGRIRSGGKKKNRLYCVRHVGI